MLRYFCAAVAYFSPHDHGHERWIFPTDGSYRSCLLPSCFANRPIAPLALGRLECQHFFHTSCLRQYLNNTSSLEPLCPICRTVIPWHPSVGGIKPPPNAHQTGGGSGGSGGSGESERAHPSASTTTSNTPTGAPATTTYDSATSRGGDEHQHHNNPLAFGPAVHRPPTPDGFSRAARGADSAVRMVRQMLRFGLTGGGGGGGAAAPGGGVAVPGGRRRDVDPSPILEADRRSGGGNGSPAEVGEGGFEGIAQQLLEIFPDMEWDAALRAARLANGSAERAVEFALSSDNSAQGVGAGAAGDDPGVGAPSPPTWHSAHHSAAAGGGGDVAEGRRRWWS